MYTIDFSALDNLNIPDEQKNQIRANLISQHKAELSVMNKEEMRFRQDCRKKSLEAGAENAYKAFPNASTEDILKKADAFYEWLVGNQK